MMTVRNPKTLIISKYFQLIIYAMAYMHVTKMGISQKIHKKMLLKYDEKKRKTRQP